MTSVVVIGAGGYLGSRLLKNLRRRSSAIGVFRDSNNPSDARADLLDNDGVAAVAEICRDALVYYCANVGGRQPAAAAPDDARRVNSDVPGYLARVARKFVYFSTDYVFSGDGRLAPDAPYSPDSVYGWTKADGERQVLAASPQSLIIRVSGLYDTDGTRARIFRPGETINASDNRVATPTYVPDLLRAVQHMIDNDDRGIRHLVGPVALSDYEFHQIASLRWGFPVRPILALERRDGPILISDSVSAVRHPTAVFAQPPVDDGTELRIFDCVGVLLGARTWKNPDSLFWAAEESRHPHQGPLAQNPCLLTDMYAPNCRLWTAVCRAPGMKILANNGRQQSFEGWVDRYQLERIFDRTINSERDSAEKPGASFAHLVQKMAGGKTVSMIDDSPEILVGARQHGWATALAVRTAQWPVSAYSCGREGW